jgi:excisionase family DNA binding protein
MESITIDIQAAGESLIQTIRSRRTALRADELADLLAMSQKHVLKLAKEQRMPSYRLGGAVRFDPGAVANLLEEKHVG